MRCVRIVFARSDCKEFLSMNDVKFIVIITFIWLFGLIMLYFIKRGII